MWGVATEPCGLAWVPDFALLFEKGILEKGMQIIVKPFAVDVLAATLLGILGITVTASLFMVLGSSDISLRS